MNRRDRRIGEALRGLDVPEHAPGFFDDLQEEMDMIDAASETVPAPVVRLDARSRRSRTAGTQRRPGVRPWAFAAAAAVVGVGLLAAVTGAPQLDPRTLPLGPQIASAAEIIENAGAAIAEMSALRGTLVVREAGVDGAGGSESEWEFAVTARGDLRMSGRTTHDGGALVEERAFDATERVEYAYTIDETGDGGSFGWKRTGLAAGVPDPAASDPLRRHLGTLVRTLLEAEDPAVAESTYEGRPAWTLSAPVDPNRIAGLGADRVEVTVDQATGLPVKVVESAGGTTVREITLTDVEVDPDLAAYDFALDFPEGVDVFEDDAGFRTVDAGTVAATVGYEPVLPAWLPEGFELAELTVATSARSTGTEGGNPLSEGVVSAAYRRGFDAIVVSTRLVGSNRGAWSDPLALGEGFVEQPEILSITGGVFAGHEAEVLMDPRGVTHLWAVGEELVLTVAGDLARAELERVAGSMEVSAP